VEGYAKRWGAGYTDYFTGNLLGNAVLASLLKEDPRYFQKGTGSFATRALWAAGGTVWCKRDNGTWGPNYANVMGNLMGAAVSNLYYPESDRTVGGTLGRGFTVTAQAIIGSEVIEFWPDIVRHHRRKQAEKLAHIQLSESTFMPASGTFAVMTGCSEVPEAFAVVMSAAPVRRPRSEGLIGVASTRTTTSSAVGSGVVTVSSEISSSPLLLISERSCSPALPSLIEPSRFSFVMV